MRRVAVLLMAALTTIVSAQTSPEVALRAAMETETVKGDLKAAIEQYQKVVDSGDRALAAQALLRIAGIYERLGSTDARLIYERVIRDFADQRDVVGVSQRQLARSGLSASPRGDRAVWNDAVDLLGGISPDGRYLTYVDQYWTGNLMLRDLEANNDRALTGNKASGDGGWADYSAISKDGTQVAFVWNSELRVASLRTSGVPESRIVFQNPDVIGIGPIDWSPDGAWLAAHLRRGDESGQIALVGLKTSSVRTLRSTGWRGTTRVFFSPDGQYIAYDLPVGDDREDRHVFVMSIDATQQTTVTEQAGENAVMGWSPDGRDLLFASNRSGTNGLWAGRLERGKLLAPPSLVKTDLGSYWSLGVSAHGSLYVWRSGSARFLRVAALELTTGRARRAVGGFEEFIGDGGGPVWSPDGTNLAYRGCRMLSGCTLAVASIATGGPVRQLRPRLSYFNGQYWAPDSRSLVAGGRNLKGQRAFYRIDASTGEVSRLMSPRLGEIQKLTADHAKIYLRRGGSIFEHEFESGQEREIFKQRAAGNRISITLSGDERFIAAVEATGTTSTLHLLSLAEGTSRPLLTVREPESLDGYRAVWHRMDVL